jgi:adenylosuccinate lyase
MIERYSRPAMAAAWSDQARMDMWLAVEKAALAALVADGVAPRSAYDALDVIDSVDVDAVQRREAQIHHDLAAFVDVLGDAAPGCAGWLHYGLTSSDVVDTGLALQIQQAGTLLVAQLKVARNAVLRRAHEHRATVMLGRTHGMPAEAITFGAKLAGWWHQLGRDEARLLEALAECAAGKLSGAVGTYTGVSQQVEATVLESLGLIRDPSATQIVQRDRHAALVAAMGICASSLDRFATEIRHLQHGDIAEVSEPFGSLQKGSSAMPHKRNPIVSERICGLARVVRSHVDVALSNIALWHERDISHSSAERVILPDAFLALDYMLERFTWLMDGLVVHAETMRANVDATHGLHTSQQALLALVESGLARDDAYRIVQVAAAAVHDGSEADLASALQAGPGAASIPDGLVERLAMLANEASGDIDTLFADLPAVGDVVETALVG